MIRRPTAGWKAPAGSARRTTLSVPAHQVLLALLALLALQLLSPIDASAQPAAGAAEAAGQPVHLDADMAARLAVTRSPREREARALIEAAQATVRAADAALLPIIEASSSAQYRSSVPELAVPILGPSSPPITIFPNIRTTASAGITARQTLLTFGATSSNRQAARLAVEASTLARTTTNADLALAARLAYWQAVATQAAYATAEAELTRAERLQQDTRALADAGMAVDADLLAATARVASTRVGLTRARTDIELARARLRSLLALTPGSPIELADASPVPLPQSPRPLADLLELARTERPELAQLTAELGRLDAQTAAAAATTKPSISLVADWSVARPNQRFLPLEDTWNDSWAVGVVASWRLYDGQRTSAHVAELRSRHEALRAQRDEVERLIALDVEQARLELRSALDTVDAADAAAAAAQAREHAEQERLQAGMARAADVLDASAEVAKTELGQTTARVGAWIARVRLDRALGR